MIIILFSLMSFAHASPGAFFADLENFRNKNLSLQTEKQNLNASTDLLLSRQLFWTPKLSLSAEGAQTSINSGTLLESDNLSANLNWNLSRGGSDWSALKGARAQKAAQELQVLNESLRVEVKAADLIFKSIYLVELKRIQEQLLKLKDESLKIVSDRYHQGKLPLQDVTKSEVDLTQQKNKLRIAQLDVLENKSQISSLFIEDLRTTKWPFTEKTNPRSSKTEKVPLVEQKYWLSQSQEAIWKASKGLHWPSLDLKFQYQQSPIKERSNSQWTGLLSLTFPLWDQFETSAKVSDSYAKYMAALNEYKDTQQSLLQKNDFLKDKIQTLRVNLIEAKNNLETSRKLYQDVLKGFRLGRISTNDLFTEQNRLLESENTFAVSQLSFHQSLIEVCALAGITCSECLE
ncbi:MAG: TolC family protein [Pseudobdellovibrionaceae bacterium]